MNYDADIRRRPGGACRGELSSSAPARHRRDAPRRRSCRRATSNRIGHLRTITRAPKRVAWRAGAERPPRREKSRDIGSSGAESAGFNTIRGVRPSGSPQVSRGTRCRAKRGSVTSCDAKSHRELRCLGICMKRGNDHESPTTEAGKRQTTWVHRGIASVRTQRALRTEGLHRRVEPRTSLMDTQSYRNAVPAATRLYFGNSWKASHA